MNDPKTLQIIAEKACQFDRAHFDDDEPTAVDSLLANHERLPTDRKLITRLRPRYAVALGFFEGYALAIEDNDELRSGPFIEHLRMLVEAKPHEGLLAALERIRRERDELQTKLVEAERIGAEHASQLEDEIRALVAERDRYKREATESKNQANIGIVIKPPPPPPPPAAPPAPNELQTEVDDELAQAAAEYANDEEGYLTTAKDIDEVHDAMKAGKGWYAIARAFVHGAQWQLSRIENAHAGDDPTMHLPPAFDRAPMPSDRLVGPANKVQNAERTQYETTIRQKNERIAELEAQLKDEIENLNETARENVKLANDAIELRAAITEYFQNEHRSDPSSLAARNHLRSLVGLPLLRSATPASRTSGSGDVSVVAPSEPTRWVRLHALREGAVFETVKGTRAVKSEYHYPDGGIECVLLASGEYAHFGDTNENHNDVLVRELVVLDPKEPKRDYSRAPDPIVFRDLVEACFWDKHTHVLASKPNTTSQSIATAADEMVEERRKRMSIRIVSETGTRPAIIGVPTANEMTDDLLLEAARFANESERFTSPADKLPPDRELECAKKAMREDCVMTWYRVCRAYVNGAQRSSRKP